ncbi:MAG: hypothetical protein HQ581_19060 [Planctomycetes bacterium]|nr:hypothetical protein [Planctomycetota bacterium]
MTKPSHTLVPLAILFVLLSLLVPDLAADEVGISFTATGSAGHADKKPRMMGWEFTVGDNPIVVTELGYQDFGLDGLAASHEVGIWRLSDEALIDSVVVVTGDPLDGHFRFAPLGTPPTLTSGTTYVISGFDNGYDPSVWDVEIPNDPHSSIPYKEMDVSGFSVNPAITIVGAHGPWEYGGFGFPDPYTIIGDGRTVLMGPNLKFSVVPEPCTFVNIIGLGLIGLAGYGWRRKRKLT